MDKEPTTIDEISSVIDDVIEVNVNDNLMSDSEVQAELADLERTDDSNDMDTTIIENPSALNKAEQSTPKMQSVVVIPVSSSYSNVSNSSLSNAPKKESKPKANRNRSGSVKRKSGKEAIDSSTSSLVSILSKVSVSNKEKSTGIITGRVDNNIKAKRVHSAGTTPEYEKAQPNKIAKIHGVDSQTTPDAKQTYSLVVRRTLNLKIFLADRPPQGKDLKNIKQFLQVKIEDALTEGANFLPIFTDPCKFGQDGIYVFCSDFRCAEWVTNAVKDGIPSVGGKLTVLPHETPLQYKPEKIMVRVFTSIPTKLPKNKILENIAKMNRDLDTEKWRISNIRPKGTGSNVYMRMDKRSFDIICARNNRVNWILGPITIKLEEHRAKPKPPISTPATNKEADSGNSNGRDLHRKPPSTENVDGKCGCEIEMDASIMNGENLKAGCVSLVRDIKHPITLARRVLEKSNKDWSSPCFFAAHGAMNFAKENGFEILPTGALVTNFAKESLVSYKAYKATEAKQKKNFGEVGTVGDVAIDVHGNIAAATTTGGMTGKIPGRIGDTPQIGSGTYADNKVGGTSSTGTIVRLFIIVREVIMRYNLATNIMKRIDWLGKDAQTATEESVKEMTEKLTETGGSITIDKHGSIGIYFSSNIMPWANLKNDVLSFGTKIKDNFEEILDK